MAGKAKGGRWRRLGRWVAGSLLLVLGLVAAVYLTRESWLHPWLVSRAERLAAERLGAELSIGAFESSWFGGAELRAVTWSAPEPPLLALDAPRVSLRWSLWRLATGSERWLRSIEAEVDSVELANPPASNSPSEPGPPPAHLPAASVHVGRLVYRLSEESAIEVADATLALVAEGDGERLALEAAEVTWRDPERAVARPLSLAARYERGRIVIEPSSVGDLLELPAGELDLRALGREAVSWSLRAEALAGSLSSSGQVVAGRLDATFSASGLELARLEELVGPFPPAALGPELRPVVSLSGRIRPAAGGPGLALELDWVEARAPALVARGVDLATVLGAGGWRAALRAARGRVLLEDGERREGRLPPLDLALSAELGDGRAVLGGRIETAGGSLRIERGEFVLGPPERLFEDARADLDVEAEFEDLRPFGKALGMDWAGRLKGLIAISGPLLAPTGRLKGNARGVAVEGFELGSLKLDVVASGGRVDVIDCELESERWGGSLSGSWSPAERRLDGVRLELSGGELALGPVAPRKIALSLTADGPLESAAGAFSLTFEDLGAARFEGLDLRAAGEFEGRSLRVDSLLAEDGELALSARGHAALDAAGDLTALVEELELSGPEGAWALLEPAPLARVGGRLHLGPVRLASRVDWREGRARLHLDGDALEAEFEGFELGPLRARLLPRGWALGGLSGTLATRLAAPYATTFDLALDELVAVRGARPLPVQDLELDGALTQGVLDLRLTVTREGGEPVRVAVHAPFDLAGARQPLQPGPVSVSLATGPLELEQLAPFLALPAGVEGSLSLAAELTGSWSDLRGSLALRVDALTSPETRAALGGAVGLDLALALGDRIEIERGELTGPAGPLMTLSGSIDAAPDPAGWLAEPRELFDAPLSVEGTFALPLEGWAERFEGVRRLGGTVEGALRLDGTLAAPDPSGRVALREAELRLASALPSIRNLNAEFEVRPEAIRIVSMGLEFGGAPCKVVGDVSLSATGPSLNFALEGENLLIARSSTARLRANADVTIRGPLDALVASGEIVVTEGRFARDVDLLSWLVPGGGAPSSGSAGQLRLSFASSGPAATTSFDLRVRSKGQIRVKGNLYDATLRPDLVMRGTGEVPLFEGEVYVDTSTLSLPSGRLQVDSGVVRFSRATPFTPEITLAAGMETKGYSITVRIDGPLGDPEILLSSTPPLPNDQLLMLFLAGQTPAATSQGLAAAQTVGVYLAQDAFARWFSGGSKEADDLFDKLVFEIGADVSQTGAQTMVGRYYLGARRTRTGRTTYLLAEKDVWDKTNFGFGIRYRFE